MTSGGRRTDLEKKAAKLFEAGAKDIWVNVKEIVFTGFQIYVKVHRLGKARAWKSKLKQARSLLLVANMLLNAQNTFYNLISHIITRFHVKT